MPAAANLAVSITARTTELEQGLDRASQRVHDFAEKISRQQSAARRATERAASSAVKSAASIVKPAAVGAASYAVLEKAATLSGSATVRLTQNVAGLAKEFARLVPLVGKQAINFLRIPIVASTGFGLAAGAVIAFRKEIARAIERGSELVGLIEDLTRVNLNAEQALSGMQGRLVSLWDRNTQQIIRFSEELRKLQGIEPLPERALTPRAQGLLDEINRLKEIEKTRERIEAFNAPVRERQAKEQAAREAENRRIREQIEAEREVYQARMEALGPATAGDANNRVLAALNEIERQQRGQELLREAALKLFHGGFLRGIKLDELFTRLGVDPGYFEGAADRAQTAGTFGQVATGRFRFGPGAMNVGKTQVEDPQLKQTNKHLNNIERALIRPQTATWGS